MTDSRGDSSKAEFPFFQGEDGGAIPTSPLQLVFRKIKMDSAQKAYRAWHYLGDQGFIAQIHFGAYFNNKLEGAISYGPTNATDLDGFWTRLSQFERGPEKATTELRPTFRWWEIKRLTMSPSCPRNSESRFIGVTLRLLRKLSDVRGVVTYADDAQGHVGTIYKAAGFKGLGLTAAKNDFWVNGKIQQRGKTKGVAGEWRPRSRKWLFVKQFSI